MSRSSKSQKTPSPDRPSRKRSTPPPKTTGDKEKKPAPPRRIEIPLISTPNDQMEMEREMEELFNEEKVTHRHGGTEPERD
jgi:anti-sigma28 factor (negative regulator of flagellin synthesis)